MTAETGNKQKDPPEGGKPEKNTLKVTVFAPRARKGKKFHWDADMTVAAAAQEAATAFEYAPGNFSLEKDTVVLDREQTLAAAGVEDKDELGLVDTGGGV